MSMDRFISLWTHPGYPPEAVSEEELKQTEARLHTHLPSDYRSAVCQYGLPNPVGALLDAIVDRELDQKDVSEFLTPSDIIDVTLEWRDLGLSEELVAFATDCIGNLFCFPTAPDIRDCLPVIWFNHDDATIDIVAPSFSEWIDAFCRILQH
ncbi:SMI1/KNR4 family protein [Blastomonas sp. SL216]|uniref:SMI1/KNR4 family protein n=1 Tax=Blastomonas sp. SL216 TaxID=2995169 RepID=UPI0023779AE5|nr:SMI1/KNR4 family protein [Blastomonas sp. SL216]